MVHACLAQLAEVTLSGRLSRICTLLQQSVDPLNMESTGNTEDSIWVHHPIARAERAEARSRSAFSALLVASYRFARMRKLCLRLCKKLEGGAIHSRSLRDILSRYHGVKIGRYTYGAVMRPGLLPSGTIVGAYCSVGTELIVRRRDHPTDRLTQHPLFYNKNLGYVRADTIQSNQDNPLTIGNDVWVGDRVTILSGCRTIGNGAVIAAGAVVTRNVDPYWIVAGVPARPVKRRFTEEIVRQIEISEWWDLPLADLLVHRKILLDRINHVSLSDLTSADGVEHDN